jgi:uncharacterized membrane protein
MSAARKWFWWLLATLAIAGIVHAATIYGLPRFVMDRALASMGTVNTIHHGKRPDATARGIVRPSPDLLYSTCPYDLSTGPVLVRAPIPPGTYWSVSAFDENTDNFFVRNDRQVKGHGIELLIAPPLTPPSAYAAPGRILVVSPTRKGLVLFRTLIDDETQFAAIDAIRRKARCAPVMAAAGD